MATTSSSSIAAAFSSAFIEGPLAAFTQELLVLGVFLCSFLAWQRLGRRAPRSLKSPKSKLVASETEPATPRKRVGSVSDVAQAEVPPTAPRQRAAAAHAAPTPHAVAAAEQQMLRHLEQREFTRALNLYRALERDGRDSFFSEDLFAAFVQSAIRVGKVDVVERMLRAMKRNSMSPSLRFWQTTLKMLSSRKHFSACFFFHQLFGNKIPTDKVVYSCLINAALEIGTPERAAAMLERYGQADIDPKDHVLFFRTYVALNDVESAETVFRKLGATASTLMLNLLLLTCVNTKQAEKAEALLQEAHELEKGAAESIVDVVSYNTVIKGFAQAGSPTHCFKCLHAMMARGLEPDDITFGTLLDACIVDNDMGAAHEIVDLLMGSDRPMDTVMCTLFIKGLVRANCLTKALGLYEEMQRREGARPDIVTYSVLIKALVDQHELDRALQLVEDMTAVGHRPDDIILTHLLEGCRHASNHALGKKLFNDLLIAGVKPSEFTLVTMLKLHGRCGAHREAYELVATWESKHGDKPSVIHYTCLMSGCLRTKNYDQAWAAYELMCSNGILPDETAVSTLLPGMVAAQQWDRVLVLAKQSLQAPSPVAVPAEALNNALSQIIIASGPGRHAEQLQSLMRGANVPITARNAKRLQ